MSLPGRCPVAPPAAPAGRPVSRAARWGGAGRAGGALALAVLLSAPGARAQPCPAPPATEAHGGWGSPRALEIAASAIAARRHAFADSALRTFRARAEGHILFLADLGALAGEQLVRADQVALEVSWQTPGSSVQRIVGRRHLDRFPSRIRYHIDHLSLVLDNFRDRIEVGEGEEVRGVLHPAAEGALAYYRYRLVDSLAITLHGRQTRVYRLEVRPVCREDPGVVGSMDVDRDSRAIARLAFTFTPSSYVDPTVDQITVELESGHVLRRFWLPVKQRVEIRRQVNWLDFPLGGIIRVRFHIGDYELDPPLRLQPGSRVASLPDSVLALYAGWEEELLAGELEQRWRDSASLQEVRARALEIVRGRHLGGSARVRAWLPDLSSAVRGRRAEGLLLGAGVRWVADGRTDVAAWGGYPLARERPEWRVLVGRRAGPWELRLEGFDDIPADIGPFRAAGGLVASLGLAIRGDDFEDPYFRTGATASAGRAAWGGRAGVALTWERQRSGRLVADPIGEVEPRPVRPIREGEELRVEVSYARPLGEAAGTVWRLRAQAEGAAPGDFEYGRVILTAEGEPPTRESLWEWEVSAGAALTAGSPPPQRLVLLGGRGTVPGYPFRGWAGDRAAFARAAVALVALPPWLRLRATGAAGWAELTGVGRAAAVEIGAGDSDGVRASLGAGLGLAWDLVRVEAVRGLQEEGRWEWIVSLNPAFRFPL